MPFENYTGTLSPKEKDKASMQVMEETYDSVTVIK